LSQVKVEELKDLRETMKNSLEVRVMVKLNRLKRWHMHPRDTVVIPNDVNS
jgi:ribosomal protein L18E